MLNIAKKKHHERCSTEWVLGKWQLYSYYTSVVKTLKKTLKGLNVSSSAPSIGKSSYSICKIKSTRDFCQKTVWVYLRHSGAVFLSPQVHLKLTEEIL